MDFIKNIFKNKKNISILSVCILVLSLVMFNSITGNTYAADTSTGTSGDVSTNATSQCYQCNSDSGIFKWGTGSSADSSCPGGYHLYSSTLSQAACLSLADDGDDDTESVFVTFNANGGYVGTTSKSYTVGSTYGSLPTPYYNSSSNDKYTFAGWYTAASGGTKVTTSSTVKASVTNLYAHWNYTEYVRLTFKTDIGTCSESYRDIEKGSSFGELPTCEKIGYSFLGWYSSSGGTKYSASSTSIVDLNLYAKWKQDEYTVTFEPNGGENTNGDYKVVHYGEEYGTLGTATRTGYTFAGWNTKADGSGTTITSTTKVSATSSHKLYAQWKRTVAVTYFSNGASHIDYSTATLTVGSKYTFPSVTKTGYNVEGWYAYDASTKVWGTNKVSTGTVVATTIAHTLGVKWNANTYSVVYNGNKSTSGSMSNSSHTYDEEKELTKNSYKRTNYKFNGWNTKADGTGTSYENEAKVKNLTTTNNGSVTLYAQWTYTGGSSGSGGSGSTETHQVIINYNPNGGVVDASTAAGSWSVVNNLIYLDGNKYETIVDYGSKLGTNGLVDYYSGVNLRVTKEGYDAKAGAEWICLSGCSTTGKTFDHSTLYSHSDFCDASDGDCTVVLGVNWQSNTYTIKYNGNGNTGGSTVDSSHVIGVESSLTANGYVKTGYTFKSWNTKADGTGINYLDEQKVKNLSSKANETITLYAIWVAEGATGEEGEVKTYTVKYNSNGGTGTLADSTHKYGYASNLSLNTFTKTGCEFVGWNTKADGTGVSYSDGQTVSNLASTDGAIVTLYAQWNLEENGDGDAGESTSTMMVDLSLDKAYTDRLNLLVNVSNLESGSTAVCEVYLIPEAGTGYETGYSKVVATINNCKNGKNVVSINNLKADTKYTFQVMVSTDGDMALGDEYVTFRTSRESVIENITESPKTGALAVILVSLISIGSLGGIFYYFKKVKK